MTKEDIMTFFGGEKTFLTYLCRKNIAPYQDFFSYQMLQKLTFLLPTPPAEKKSISRTVNTASKPHTKSTPKSTIHYTSHLIPQKTHTFQDLFRHHPPKETIKKITSAIQRQAGKQILDLQTDDISTVQLFLQDSLEHGKIDFEGDIQTLLKEVGNAFGQSYHFAKYYLAVRQDSANILNIPFLKNFFTKVHTTTPQEQLDLLATYNKNGITLTSLITNPVLGPPFARIVCNALMKNNFAHTKPITFSFFGAQISLGIQHFITTLRRTLHASNGEVFHLLTQMLSLSHKKEAEEFLKKRTEHLQEKQKKNRSTFTISQTLSRGLRKLHPYKGQCILANNKHIEKALAEMTEKLYGTNGERILTDTEYKKDTSFAFRDKIFSNINLEALLTTLSIANKISIDEVKKKAFRYWCFMQHSGKEALEKYQEGIKLLRTTVATPPEATND